MPQKIVKGVSGAASIALKRMVNAIPVMNKNWKTAMKLATCPALLLSSAVKLLCFS